MSAIADIINVIEALAVKAVTGGSNITCLDLTEFREAVPAMETPQRVILPSDEDNAAVFGYLTVGRAHQIDWSISDLLLYKTAGEGFGWYDVGNALVTYSGNYATAVAGATKSLRTYGGAVTGLTMRRGIYTYSGTQYYGVMCTLMVRELLQCPT
jgi:hypothetical protein